MSTQYAPAALARKIAGLALLIIGGLFTAYGVNYGVTATAVVGGLMVVLGVIIFALGIVRRNQGQI